MEWNLRYFLMDDSASAAKGVFYRLVEYQYARHLLCFLQEGDTLETLLPLCIALAHASL
jgi:hypothetical protein